MGEYATRKSDGQSVKIGTCESMYYLRYDQIDQVSGVGYDLRKEAVRFRFPFPTEDNVAPGDFSDHTKGVQVNGAKVPADVEHSIVQFVASAGYNLCVPCPESVDGFKLFTIKDGHAVSEQDLKIHRNGWRGGVKVMFQRIWEGRLITICECGACGALYRLETPEMAQEIADLLTAEYDRRQHDAMVGPHYRDGSDYSHEGRFYLQMAERIMAGYMISA